MVAANDPNLVVAELGVTFLLLVGLWRFIGWVREAPRTPDPWDAEVEGKLAEADAVEICPHCSREQAPGAWFCPHCGKAVGPYNNLMPFVNVFSEGEVLRNGMTDRFRNRRFVLFGYLLLSLAAFATVGLVALVLAPVYWFMLWSRLCRSAEPITPAGEPDSSR